MIIVYKIKRLSCQTKETHRPQTKEMHRPQTKETHRPKTKETHRPKVVLETFQR